MGTKIVDIADARDQLPELIDLAEAGTEVIIAINERHLVRLVPLHGSGQKKRIAGLTLRATDTEWSTGSGPTVEGPAQQLLLAVAGRRPALDQLSGDGLATLRAR